MFKVISRGQPGVVGGGEKKYYATIVRDRSVTLRQFIKQISQLNTVNTADIYAVLESFLQLVPQYLSEGRTVDLGQLGKFSISISSKGEESPEEVSRSNIIGHKVLFKPSAEMRDLLTNVKFEKVANPDLEPEPETSDAPGQPSEGFDEAA